MDLQVACGAGAPRFEAKVFSRDPRRRDAVAAAKVCIVEDDDDIREALEELLDGAGYETVSYERADCALRDLERLAPDLILLDLMMPGMNGWQFRIEQKRHEKLSEIPVVVLSADVSPYAAAIDADAYISKPVDFDKLEATVEKVLLARERRRLVARAVELERIRSLGLLTASVAHEINNPLTYLIGCLDLAERQARAHAEGGPSNQETHRVVHENVVAATDGAERISAIVRLLSTFSRADDVADRPFDPVHAVQAAVRLARHQLEKRARLVTSFESVSNVLGNEGRFSQVVLNLLINAVHALSEASADSHEIHVATRVEQGAVLVEIADDGPGIDPGLHEQIFQPFFTTKPPGVGTGLGLSISREIVTSMGGTIGVVSQLGAGATFRIVLPAIARERTERDPSPGATATDPALRVHGLAPLQELALCLSALCRRGAPGHDRPLLSSSARGFST